MNSLEANCFSPGSEFRLDKDKSDTNDLQAISTTPESWFDFFNDCKQPEDKLGSTETDVDDTASQICPTQLFVSLNVDVKLLLRGANTLNSLSD